MWTTDLESHVTAFLESASLIAQWDDELLASSDSLTSLQDTVTGIQEQQRKLHNVLNVCKEHQRDLASTLDSLDSELNKLSESGVGSAQNEMEVRREESYRLAEEIDAHLGSLSNSLSESINSINESSKPAQEQQSLLGQMTDILNVHLQSLTYIDSETGAIERSLSNLQRDSQLQTKQIINRQTNNQILSLMR